MNIPDFPNKIKAYTKSHKKGLILSLILAMVAVSSFYLGYSAKGSTARASEVLIQCPIEAYKALNSPIRSISPLVASEVEGSLVASKNGKNYYPINCAGAKRIKPENAVYFNSAIEAEAKGYTLSKTCN